MKHYEVGFIDKNKTTVTMKVDAPNLFMAIVEMGKLALLQGKNKVKSAAVREIEKHG